MTRFFALLVVAQIGCKPTAVPPQPVDTPSVVYGELVEAGCIAQSPDGIDAIAEEHADPAQPDWFACLFDGGTVFSCNVPCSN
jgi:hypothetical protein